MHTHRWRRIIPRRHPVDSANPELRTLSLLEAVEATGIPERTLRTLVNTRRIPFVKVGKFLRFKPSDLQGWLEENTRPVLAAKAKR